MTARDPANSPSVPKRGPAIWIGLVGAVVLVLLSWGAYQLIPSLANHEICAPERPQDPSPDEMTPIVCGPAWFRDMTAHSGIAFSYRNGEEADHFAILELVGGGIALFDYDGDGLIDVFVTAGGFYGGADKSRISGLPCKLFKNLGGWKFKDVTKEAGLAIDWWYTNGVAVADYDRDGWPDLLVTGYGRIALFHNEPDGNGGRRLVDVSEKLGLRNDRWSTGAGWADIDGDGFPDLFVCNYTDWSMSNNPHCAGQVPGVARDVCPPKRFKRQVPALFRNHQGKSFQNVTNELGVLGDGYGLGVVLADLNGDGRPDIYVTNDETPNLLFMNRGGRFEEKSIAAGCALDDTGRATASMGIDVGDYDGSGRPALFITNFQREIHSLYRNLGNELFYYQSSAAGLAALGRTYVGWGTSFLDVDNDGWEDLIVVNGHLYRVPAGSTVKQRPYLLRNVAEQGRRLFRDISPQGGASFQTPTVARGLGIADLDNDGWPDLVICNTNGPVALFRNEASAAHPKTRWLGVKLTGKGHRDVNGSTVVLECGQRKLTRFAKGGGSYLSANDRRIVFGLGETELPSRLTVKWSWGESQSWDRLEPNCYYELHEGQAAPSVMATVPRQ